MHSLRPSLKQRPQNFNLSRLCARPALDDPMLRSLSEQCALHGTPLAGPKHHANCGFRKKKKEGGQPRASSSHGAVERCCSDAELNGRGCPACVSMRAGEWLTQVSRFVAGLRGTRTRGRVNRVRAQSVVLRMRKLGRSSREDAGRVSNTVQQAPVLCGRCDDM